MGWQYFFALLSFQKVSDNETGSRVKGWPVPVKYTIFFH